MANPTAGTTATKIATRDAYGKTLAALGAEDPRIVVLDADLSGSTRTNWFRDKFPERHINVGVAEQNLVGTAAGLALSGMVPFASSFAMFLSGRAWEITRNSVAYPNLNVKLVASHAGITVGEDGASHQCIEDLATMRVIPGMQVFVPSDSVETEAIIRAVAAFHGPCYVRTGRAAVPVFHTSDYKWRPGKGELLRSGNRATIIACGVMVAEAIVAADLLATEGINVGVINMASIKPLDEELVAAEAAKSGLVVTCEEHSVIGGLGSAVAEALARRQPTRQIFVGMQDSFGKSGTADALMDYFELRGKHIADRIRAALKK